MSSLKILILASLNALAFAQTHPPLFNTRQDTYTRADAFIIADLNGDGIVDLITSAPTSVLLGNGDGTFGAPVTYDIGGGPIVLADINGDGNPDLVSGVITGALGVAFGNGDGTFESSQTNYILPGPSLPISLATGDFNGDGRMDVAVATGTGGVFIYLNQGGGALALTGNYFPGRFTAAVTAEDIDGDGFLDLAVAVGEHVTFLMGSGTGAFRTGQTFSTTYPPGTVLFADMNNDGIADMVVSGGIWTGYFFKAYLFFGTGGGAFAAPQTISFPGGVGQIVTGDVNHDGYLDLVTLQATPDQVGILLNNGNGTFRMGGHFAVCGAAGEIAVAPLRYPRLLDIVALGPLSYEVSVLLNSGNGTYPDGLKIHLTAQPGPLVAGDFNGDGLDDLAVTTTVNVQIYLNSGKLANLFTPGQSIALQPTQTLGGDFNGDGIPDLAMVIPNNQIAVVLGSGDGTFSPPVVTPAGGIAPNNLPVQIFAGDFDGDGKLDLVTTFNGLLFGNGDGSFKPAQAFMSAATIQKLGIIFGMVVSDLNRDGKTDFVALGSNEGIFSFINVGRGVFIVSGPAPGSAALQLLTGGAVADFNADGIPDIAVASDLGAAVLFGAGGGSFLPVHYTSPLANPFQAFGIVAGDFNGDGRSDFVVTGYYPQSDAIVFTGNGDQTFQLPIYFGTAPNSDYIVKGHFNKFRPGQQDLAVSTLDGVDILLNTTK